MSDEKKSDEKESGSKFLFKFFLAFGLLLALRISSHVSFEVQLIGIAMLIFAFIFWMNSLGKK
jgi:hypothetical protein